MLPNQVPINSISTLQPQTLSNQHPPTVNALQSKLSLSPLDNVQADREEECVLRDPGFEIRKREGAGESTASIINGIERKNKHERCPKNALQPRTRFNQRSATVNALQSVSNGARSPINARQSTLSNQRSATVNALKSTFSNRQCYPINAPQPGKLQKQQTRSNHLPAWPSAPSPCPPPACAAHWSSPCSETKPLSPPPEPPLQHPPPP